jgi:hypothetical protein
MLQVQSSIDLGCYWKSCSGISTTARNERFTGIVVVS